MFLTTPGYILKPSFSAFLSKRSFPPPHIFLLSNLPTAREFYPIRLSRFTFISTQFVNNVALYTSNPVLYPPQHHPVEPARYTWHPTHTLIGLMHPLTQFPSPPPPPHLYSHCVVGLIQTPKVYKGGPPCASHGRSSAFPQTTRSLPRPHCAVQ